MCLTVVRELKLLCAGQRSKVDELNTKLTRYSCNSRNILAKKDYTVAKRPDWRVTWL